MWRGGLGSAYLFSGSFVCRCLNSLSILRFHIPLIEPDRRFSRIRLSEKAFHAFAHRTLRRNPVKRTNPSPLST
jgi:hypothetical protein